VEQRVRKVNDAGIRPGGRYVVYWLRYNRRVESNHALAFAAGLANRLALPLLVFETLPCGGAYDTARRHTFVLEGIPELERRLRTRGIGYLFHLPHRAGGELRALSEILDSAAALVTDDFPASIERHFGDPALDGITIQCFAVDSSCVVPASVIPVRCHAAYSIRPKIHKIWNAYLKPAPEIRIGVRFPSDVFSLHTKVKPECITTLVQSCQVDHSVGASTTFRGGRPHAERALQRFIQTRLHRYAAQRNEPSAHATSHLSPYLHFGHISALETALAVREHAAAHAVLADAFLEELIVRRELAFNFARYASDVASLEELSDWARATLNAHRQDTRDPVYTAGRFESAATHDDLWNATQKELVLRGKIHGYYRMYWGKKILEWSESPDEALATMVHLHDRYAIDGRDPNTYANILWCFGLHDRPWPERPIFGMVRSMTRAGMDRKTDTSAYIKEVEYLERTGKELAQ
jgi:deoxyribodipyrimidine photo-lyase